MSDPKPTALPGELANYREYLDHYRATLSRQCGGLSVKKLAKQPLAPSNLSLLGLVRHLAKVEHHWFRRVLEGQADLPRLYQVEGEKDWDFTGVTADEADAAEAFDSWHAEIDHADAYLATMSDADMSAVVVVHGEDASVRDILVHLIEEYARHAGHADLLRERIDGTTGL